MALAAFVSRAYMMIRYDTRIRNRASLQRRAALAQL